MREKRNRYLSYILNLLIFFIVLIIQDDSCSMCRNQLWAHLTASIPGHWSCAAGITFVGSTLLQQSVPHDSTTFLLQLSSETVAKALDSFGFMPEIYELILIWYIYFYTCRIEKLKNEFWSLDTPMMFRSAFGSTEVHIVP